MYVLYKILTGGREVRTQCVKEAVKRELKITGVLKVVL
jgi:hypothetical protein